MQTLTEKIDALLKQRESAKNTPDNSATLLAPSYNENEVLNEDVVPTFVVKNEKAVDTQEEMTPEKWYEEAIFTLLEEGQYQQAEGELNTFVKMYADHPLVQNAHYWLGEIHYKNKEFGRAQKEFMSAYALNPTAEKGLESLLKMAITYNELEKNDRACAALSILREKFADVSTTTRLQADNYFDRMNCDKYNDTATAATNAP